MADRVIEQARIPLLSIVRPLLDALRETTNRDEEKRVDDTAKLFLAATEIYATEKPQVNAILPYLQNVLGIELQQKPNVETGRKTFKTDAMATETIEDVSCGEKEAIIGYFEFKNETGLRRKLLCPEYFGAA